MYVINKYKDKESKMSYLYKNIKALRQSKGYTQEDIAHILQTRQEQYCKYELGKREIPVHHLITLAKFYMVSTDYILGLEKNKSNKK